jgi:hypothetical protein
VLNEENRKKIPVYAYVCICKALTSLLGSLALGRNLGIGRRLLARRLGLYPVFGDGGVWKRVEINEAAARLVVFPKLPRAGMVTLDRDLCLLGIMIPVGKESRGEALLPSSSSSESNGLGVLPDGVAADTQTDSGYSKPMVSDRGTKTDGPI